MKWNILNNLKSYKINKYDKRDRFRTTNKKYLCD